MKKHDQSELRDGSVLVGETTSGPQIVSSWTPKH